MPAETLLQIGTEEAPEVNVALLEPSELVEANGSDPEVEKNPLSPLEILISRRANGYRPGIDKDGHKVGLTFDPGAYAGIVGLAMARKLQVAGLLDFVDAFYGLSAGGVNAAYAATGQLKEGMDIYVNLMPDNGLVTQLKVLPPTRPKMNLNVLRDAMTTQQPLDIQKLIDSKAPVVVGVADMDSPYERAKMFNSAKMDPKHPEKFIEQMIMGCNIPVLAGGPIKAEDGHRYTDATMAWTSSVELAREDYCTDILSLANTPPSSAAERKSIKSKFGNYAAGVFGNKYLNEPGTEHGHDYDWKDFLIHPFKSAESYLLTSLLGEGSDHKYYNYSRVLERKAEAEQAFTDGHFEYRGSQVERIYPPDVPGLPELLTTDKRRLRIGIRAARLAVRECLKTTAA